MFQEVEIMKPKLIKIKKNQIDMTTGFLYSMGCSIIHLALLITLFIIKKPNLAEATRIDNDYNTLMAKDIKTLNFTGGRVSLCENEAKMYY